jgi:hypothetical protein
MTDNVDSRRDPQYPDGIVPNEFWASLRVVSSSLSLDEVTRRLGPPTRGHSIGDPVGRVPRKFDNTVWQRKASGKDTALEPLVEEVVTFAEGHAEALKELREAGCRADVPCSIFPGTRQAPAREGSSTYIFGCGVVLAAALLRRLAALELDLDISVAADLDLKISERQ